MENNVEFVGNFSCFSDAWDFMEYVSDKRYVWLIKEENLVGLRDKINKIFDKELALMCNYNKLTDKELKELLESDAIQEYDKLEIINELIDRGSVEFIREEYIH